MHSFMSRPSESFQASGVVQPYSKSVLPQSELEFAFLGVSGNTLAEVQLCLASVVTLPLNKRSPCCVSTSWRRSRSPSKRPMAPVQHLGPPRQDCRDPGHRVSQLGE